MTPAAAESLRRAAAHVLVDDVATPVLDDQSQHHVFRVLRVRDGEAITVTDGAGGWRLGSAAAAAEQSTAAKCPAYFVPGIVLRNVVFLIIVLAHGFRRLAPPW